MITFVDKHQAAQCLGVSSETLKKYRLRGEWIKGIHWVEVNSRCIRYNLELIQDWMQNRHNLTAHQRTIEIYETNLLNRHKKLQKKPF